MKTISMIIFPLLPFVQAATAQVTPEKLWETEAILKTPESVLHDKSTATLYFSNIDGDPKAKDGKGSIGKMGANGKDLVIEWVDGLNAPKGMGIYEGALYVTNIDEIVIISVAESKILNRVPVPGASFLNDITVDNQGLVYISDMGTGNIHTLDRGKLSTWLDNIKSVNGLLAVDNDLYYVAAGTLWRSGPDRKSVKIAEGMDSSTDGITQMRDKSFIVSCWTGVVYHVKPDGTVKQILDTRPQKLNTADIGLDAAENILYVPTFFGNKITAYKLRQ